MGDGCTHVFSERATVKNVFIHAGLHKTGTTALQKVLSRNRARLSAQDFHYPVSGIPEPHYGHHNLAWQLSRDRRFRTEHGDFPALAGEIEGSDHGNILLSSEDFECSLLHPCRWNEMTDFFATRDIKPVFVVYLRRPGDYLVSLYGELLKAGLGSEFAKFAGTVGSSGTFEFEEWEFIFDHSRIPRSLQSLKNAELILRDFDDLIGGDTVVDFCHVTGIEHGRLEIPGNVTQINKRPPPNHLLKLFVRNRRVASPDGILDIVDELGIEDAAMRPMDTTWTSADPEDRDPPSGASRSPELDGSAPALLDPGRIFSFETINFLLELQGLGRDRGFGRIFNPRKPKGNQEKKTRLIDEWRLWVSARGDHA